MKLRHLSEATISHQYSTNQSEWPGIEMSKILANLAQKALPGDDAHIQIIGRQEQWAATIKITKGRKSVDINIKATPDEAYANIIIPGSVGSRPGIPSIKPREIGRYDLMNPLSFENSVQDAVQYLIS